MAEAGGVNVTVNSKSKLATIALVKKLELTTTNVCSVREIFSSSSNAIRNKLKDQCIAIITNDTSDLARKAEDIVWRKVYHDVMQAFKRFKKVCI